MVDNQQVTVSERLSVIDCLAFSMTVRRMTLFTVVAYPCRTKSPVGVVRQGKGTLEEVFTSVEAVFHTRNIRDSRCRVGISSSFRRTQFTSRIPLFGTEHIVLLAEIRFFLCKFVFICRCSGVIRTGCVE